MTVEVVFTERLSDLDELRAQNFGRLRERLAVAAGGQPVEVAHYEAVDAQRLARSSTIVLSGATTRWALRDPAELDRLGEAVVAAGRPVLGICAGMQLLVRFAGGEHRPSPTPEHGFLPIQVHDTGDLLRGVRDEAVVFHDHDEEISRLPRDFRVLASSPACAIQAIADSGRRWWGTQFHPEEFRPEHPAGEQILHNFFALAG